jgi:hypothetical protein
LESAETSVPAWEEIPSIGSFREACSNYGEAVQSNVFYVQRLLCSTYRASHRRIDLAEKLSLRSHTFAD